uniref:sn-1-specific diacylglycerol lipase n=2 Tax=Cacopsylla melanoneura TaxID=428564 RepID=A0A8D8WTA5_9HEMI
MPALRMLGRQWTLGSDNFVFPGVFGLIFGTVWASLHGVVCHNIYSDTSSCLTKDITRSNFFIHIYLLGVLCLLVVDILLTVVLICKSAQGSIFDTHKRKSVPYIVIAKLLLLLPQIILHILASVWTFENLPSQCFNVAIKTEMEDIIFINCIMLIVTCIGYFITLDPLNSKKPKKDSDGAAGGKDSDHSARVQAQDVTLKSFRSRWSVWKRRFKVICCVVVRDENALEAFSQIATLFGFLLDKIDLVPSDAIAGCILLRVRREMELKEQKKLQEVRVTDFQVQETEKCTGEDAPQWMTMANAQHFFKFAIAAYGFPYAIYRHPATWCFHLSRSATCCACLRTKPTIVKGDDCFLCSFGAVRWMSDISPKDILYCSFKNKVFKSPFFVVADHETKSIVVVIRGSLSIRDFLTDLCGMCAKMEGEGIPPETMAHSGMLRDTNYVKSTLQELQILQKAFQQFPDYQLVIAGHSLGAGVAVLLGLQLRSQYPSLRVFSFSTPGGMISHHTARYTEQFAMSVVLGNDVVPRLGVASVEKTFQEMMDALRSCRLPKYRIYLNGLGYVLFGVPAAHLESIWKDQKKVKSSSTSVKLVNRCTQTTINGSPDERSKDNLSNGGTDELSVVIQVYPELMGESPAENIPTVEISSRRFPQETLYTGGKVMWITKRKKEKTNKTDVREKLYDTRWASCVSEFNDITVSSGMLFDHLPEQVYDAMNLVLEHQGTRIEKERY